MTFRANYLPGQIYPSLFIDLEHMGGSSYVGGTRQEDAWQKKLIDLWMLPDDSTADPTLLMRSLKVREPKAGAEIVQAQRLSQLASAAPLSLLACLPPCPGDDLGSPERQMLSPYLRSLQDRPPFLRHKWRRGVLLLTYSTWFQDQEDDSRITWALVKQFRQAEVNNKGVLPIKDLARLCAQLDDAQAKRLVQKFPGMGEVPEWHDLLSQITNFSVWGQRLLSPQGARLDEAAVAAVAAHLPIASAFREGKITRLRIEKAPTSTRSSVSQVYSVEALSDSGAVIAEADLTYLGHQFDTLGVAPVTLPK